MISTRDLGPRVPPAALLLGLAGVLPFAWGAMTLLMPAVGAWSLDALGPRYTGRTLLLLYGSVILAFMSGVVWGFATRGDGRRAALLYALSTAPALWAAFAGFSALALALGFALLLVLDARAQAWGLAPPWWMRLRVLLTTLVVLFLLAGVP